MTTFLKSSLAGLVASTALVAASASFASITVTVEEFTKNQYAAAKAFESAYLGGLNPNRTIVTEDFESLAVDAGQTPVGNSVMTSVGTFTQNQTGQINGGLRVLDDATSPFKGRRDMTSEPVGEGQWLDSNDSKKVTWTVDFVNDVFDLGFFLTDVNDVSASMTATFADGSGSKEVAFPKPDGAAKNGNILYVGASFESAVSSVMFHVDTRNDGWGIDDVSISAVPVPFAGVLMLTALGGAAAAYRRRKS